MTLIDYEHGDGVVNCVGFYEKVDDVIANEKVDGVIVIS